MKFLGADNQVDIGQLVEQGGAAVLGHAAQNPEHEARVVPSLRGHVAGLADGLLLGEIPHTAGVEQQDVAIVLPVHDAIAPRAQQGGDRLAVAFVHLAAVGFDEDPIHASWRQSRRDRDQRWRRSPTGGLASRRLALRGGFTVLTRAGKPSFAALK